MRAIKFRAWDRRESKMLQWEKLGFAHRSLWLHWQTVMSHITIDESNIGYAVMQFTGLFDRHGKEIYEGDIVKYQADGGNDIETDYIEEVVYEGSCFNVDGHVPLDAVVDDFHAEVIGNIYEHPELLKNQTNEHKED